MSVRLSRWRRAAGRFKRDRQGAVAVEFGLVAIPFFMIVIGLFEISLIGLAQNSLDHATSNMARRIRVGEVQTTGMSLDQVREQMCGEVNSFLNANCMANLSIDVETYESFVAVSSVGPIDPDNLQFNPGAPSDIVLMRTTMNWSVVTPMFQPIFANEGSDRVLASSLLFRNEPWPAAPPP
jgi:Flp pilus assembly protein TadG